MNTLGLKRKTHTFGLGELNLVDVVSNAYHEVQKFVLRIGKKINFNLGS